MSLRATGDRVLLRRVQDRTSSLVLAGEVMGLTDRVLQVGEVLGMGSEWITGKLRGLELQLRDLVVYNQARVHDHFRWSFGTDGGECDVLVYPGYWVLAILRGGLLVENPHLRTYGRTLE